MQQLAHFQKIDCGCSVTFLQLKTARKKNKYYLKELMFIILNKLIENVQELRTMCLKDTIRKCKLCSRLPHLPNLINQLMVNSACFFDVTTEIHGYRFVRFFTSWLSEIILNTESPSFITLPAFSNYVFNQFRNSPGRYPAQKPLKSGFSARFERFERFRRFCWENRSNRSNLA